MAVQGYIRLILFLLFLSLFITEMNANGRRRNRRRMRFWMRIPPRRGGGGGAGASVTEPPIPTPEPPVYGSGLIVDVTDNCNFTNTVVSPNITYQFGNSSRAECMCALSSNSSVLSLWLSDSNGTCPVPGLDMNNDNYAISLLFEFPGCDYNVSMITIQPETFYYFTIECFTVPEQGTQTGASTSGTPTSGTPISGTPTSETPTSGIPTSEKSSLEEVSTTTSIDEKTGSILTQSSPPPPNENDIDITTFDPSLNISPTLRNVARRSVNKTALGIGLGVGALVVLGAVCGVVFFLRRKRARTKDSISVGLPVSNPAYGEIESNDAYQEILYDKHVAGVYTDLLNSENPQYKPLDRDGDSENTAKEDRTVMVDNANYVSTELGNDDMPVALGNDDAHPTDTVMVDNPDYASGGTEPPDDGADVVVENENFAKMEEGTDHDTVLVDNVDYTDFPDITKTNDDYALEKSVPNVISEEEKEPIPDSVVGGTGDSAYYLAGQIDA